MKALKQYDDYNGTHSELIAKEAVSLILKDKKLEDIIAFHDHPKFGHIGFYTNLQVDKKLIPAELKNHKWNLLSLALLVKNSALFNTLVTKYSPMVR
jgi:hypothetical protein